MTHAPSITAELRDLPPVDGWRVSEQTGRARTTCPCGTDTGLTTKADARTTLREHCTPERA
ncbi:hypothetical protein ACLQ2E_17915 [Streptomyces lavendulocolor]